MERGLLNYAKDFLWKPKATDGVAMGVVPMGRTSLGGEAIKPGDMQSQLRANKGIVYACTDLIGLGVGTNPMRVYVTLNGKEKSNFKLTQTKVVSKERKDEIFKNAAPGSTLSQAADLEEVVNGPLVELLHDLNDHMSYFDGKKLTSVNMDLTGNAYWILLRNSLGFPASVWFVPSTYMSVIPGEEEWIKGYKYKKGSKEIKYPKEDVIHFKCVSPASQYYGVAPLLACLDAYNLREYMMNFEQQMFKTGGNPKMIVYTKNQVDKKQADQIKSRIKQIGDGDIAILSGEDFTLHDVPGTTARDMGYREGLLYTREEIAMVFHIPTSMLAADKVYAGTSKAQENYFEKYALQPRCTQIDGKLSEDLAPQFDDRYVILFDNPVKEDATQALEDRKVNIALAITARNEERAKMGLPPIEGWDDLLPPTTFGIDDDDEAEIAERVAIDAMAKASRFKLKREWRAGRDRVDKR